MSLSAGCRRAIVSFSSTAILSTVALSTNAGAQIVLDGSIGEAGAIPIPDVGGTYSVTGAQGHLVGDAPSTQNLFYGFSRFDVEQGKTARFTPGDGFSGSIDNIVARIRSPNGDPSSVAGSITSDYPGASIYLINPRGVLFSPTAKVDVSGSMYVSTATDLVYSSHRQFDVKADSPVMLAEPLVAFGFDAGGAGAIGLEGTLQFRSDPGARPGWVGSFTAVGSSVEVGRDGTPTLSASLGAAVPAAAGTIQLAAVGSSEVEVPVGIHGYSPSESAVGPDAPIVIHGGSTLRNRGASDAGGAILGRVVVRGGSLTIEPRNDFVVKVTAGGGDGSVPDGGARVLPAIDVEVSGTASFGSGVRWETISQSHGLPRASGDLRVVASSLSLSNGGSYSATPNFLVAAGGRDDGGSIDLRADQKIAVTGSFWMQTASYGNGSAGDLKIDAGSGSLLLSGGSFLESVVPAGSNDGGAGCVDIKAGSIEIMEGSQVSATTDGSRKAGNVRIHDFSTMLIDSTAANAGQQSGIFARSGKDAANTSATGSAGNISIEGGSLVVREGGQISTAAFYEGGTASAGSIRIALSGSLVLDGGSNVSTESSTHGDAGSVWITAPDLRILNGSRVAASSTNSGSAGRIDLVGDRILVSGRRFGESGDGTSIVSQTVSPIAGGDAGDIRIQAEGSLEISDHALISATARGDGKTGDIHLTSNAALAILDRARIEATGARDESGVVRGAAGDVSIHGRDLSIRNADVTTEAGRANSGNIRLTAGRLIAVSNRRNGFVADSTNQRNPLTTFIRTDVDAQGGQGGDVSLDAPFVVLERATVTANADQANANAGNIRLTASEAYLGLGPTLLEATASEGISGQILIEAPETNFLGDIAVLSGDLLDVSDEVTQSCMQRGTRVGSLQVSGDTFSQGLPDDLSLDPEHSESRSGDGDRTR